VDLSRREGCEALLAEDAEDSRALVAADASPMRTEADMLGSDLGPSAPSVTGRAGDAERGARGLHAELAVMGIDEHHARLPSLGEVASRSISSIISAILF
jgi:hypothetical protein